MLKDAKIKRKLYLIFIALLVLFSVIIYGKYNQTHLQININNQSPQRGEIIEISFSTNTNNINKISAQLRYDSSVVSYVSSDVYNEAISLEYDPTTRIINITLNEKLNSKNIDQIITIRFEVLEKVTALETALDFDNIILNTTKHPQIHQENVSIPITISN